MDLSADAEIEKIEGRLIFAMTDWVAGEKIRDVSRHAEDDRRYLERKKAVEGLCEKIVNGISVNKGIEVENALWQCVIAYQNYPFYTTSGLPFTYTVKCKRNGEYSGELLVSRKEGSKTLTRSSIILAFHKVLESIKIVNVVNTDGSFSTVIVPPEYKGPKAIGQIFGISYVYSLFWKWRLITVPEKVEAKLHGNQ